METSTPRITPTSTVARAIVPASNRADAPAKRLQNGPAEYQRRRGKHQRKAEHHIDEAASRFAIEVELPQHDQRQDAGRNAAGGEPHHRRPVDAARPAVDSTAADLGRCRVEQVGADRRRGMNAKQQDQQRRHQRSAAHPGHADQHADAETRKDIEGINHRRRPRQRTIRRSPSSPPLPIAPIPSLSARRAAPRSGVFNIQSGRISLLMAAIARPKKE